MDLVISMITALVLISIVLISGGARMYFRRKFDISDELNMLDAAAKRQHNARQRLHNAQR